MAGYPFGEIESKWQKYWAEHGTFVVTEDPAVPRERRVYVLDMFPYPSSAGLHVGHPEGYTATDIYCRYLRMKGRHVLHPMGYDSFGLPAENYAIQTGIHPRKSTEANIERFQRQIESLGFSYDWSRKLSTHEPEYYRWTQWIFLKLWEKGLAYRAEVPVWFCPEMGTVLANEEVVATPEGPRSERGSHPVERKPLLQWMLKITAYADRLLNDLESLDWPESIKIMQRNWIGRSEGANVVFGLAEGEGSIEVYTTRPDTLFGATYMVLAPEHELVSRITTADRKVEVERYVAQARVKSDLERTDLAKEKTGAFTGAYAVNPVNGQKIPVWISDYILVSYGTGAIMAVPGHDARDFAFARLFGLPILQVVSRDGKPHALDEAYVEEGYAINSGAFSGLPTAECVRRITAWLEERGLGRKAVNFKLRDWVFSRQRYWGEPIPLVHCPVCGIVPVPEAELPLKLPQVEGYRPTGTGESPLASITEWVNAVCPTCGQPARRETNTMPQWAGSCWYYLRYTDPRNDQALAARERLEYWLPVDLYVGGAEHAVLHLLYARFWHKFLFDIGVVPTPEPFARLINQGMILGEGGAKMSKSLGNVINPDEVVTEYGADAMRLYEMFMGPLEDTKPWSTQGIVGIKRFLDRVWVLGDREMDDGPLPDGLARVLHKTIKKVTEGTGRLAFNTAIAQMMVLVNEAYKEEPLYRLMWEPFILMLSPYAPHLCEELWAEIGKKESLAHEAFPVYDESLVVDAKVTVVFQVNGKVRAREDLPADLGEQDLIQAALANDRIRELTEGREILKTFAVPGRLVNLVLREI